MPQVIDVHGLSKSFGDNRVVDNLSLEVKRGEIFGFLGPNGSGKTTTMRMLCGLLLPDAGEGQCAGFDILEQQREIKSEVGYVSQHFSLYADLTVRENLIFAARLNHLPNPEQTVDAAIERHSLQHFTSALMGNLSGGWKQRVALALSTLHNPKLLLLDEPTSGIDPEARQKFWNAIHRYASEGLTVLVTTHYLDEAEMHCQRIAYIMDGKLLVTGTVQEVIDSAGMSMWRLTNAPDDFEMQITQSGIDAQVIKSTEGLLLSGENQAAVESTLQRMGIDFAPFTPRLADAFMWMSRRSQEHQK